MFRRENLTSHLVRMKNSSYYIAPVGNWTHDLPLTVASNMVKVSHALIHSATEAVYLIIMLTQMLFSLCRTTDCITTRETRIYPCHRPQHWCIHRLGRWQIWSSRWCYNHVYMYTISHHICIVMWAIFFADDNVDPLLFVVSPDAYWQIVHFVLQAWHSVHSYYVPWKPVSRRDPNQISSVAGVAAIFKMVDLNFQCPISWRII